MLFLYGICFILSLTDVFFFSEKHFFFNEISSIQLYFLYQFDLIHNKIAVYVLYQFGLDWLLMILAKFFNIILYLSRLYAFKHKFHNLRLLCSLIKIVRGFIINRIL